MAAGDTVKSDYEEFEPLCYWKRELERDTLKVIVEGFEKNNLKVQLNNASVMIISGQSPLDETKSKWRHFKKEIRLLEDYKKDEIHAKFSSGVLHIAMPKKSSSTTTSEIQVQEWPKLPTENQENERNRSETTLDTIASNIKGKEMKNKENIMISETSKLSSYGGFRVRNLVTKKKMARILASAVALASILGVFAIYKYCQQVAELRDQNQKEHKIIVILKN